MYKSLGLSWWMILMFSGRVGDMIYMTVIVCSVIVLLIVVVVAYVVKDIVGDITAAVQDMQTVREDNKLEELDAIGQMFSTMVYGPGQVPTKSAEEIMAGIREQVDAALTDEDEGFPIHEIIDDRLAWLPNEPPPFPDDLLPLPEHEDNDEFMNGVDNDAQG